MRVFLLSLCLGACALAQRGPAPVVVADVIERELRREVSFVGNVEPLRVSRVASEVDGRLLALLVREGDTVGVGRPLARLRSTELEIGLAGARAELRLREQELLELENGTRPEEIARVEARFRAADADVRYRQWSLEQTRNLLRAEKTSQDALRQAELALDRAEAIRDEAKAEADLARAGPRGEAIAQAAARVAVQEETVRALEDRLARYRPVAPFAGYVLEESTEAGQWLSEGSPLITLAQLDTVEVEVAVPEGDVASLALGDSVRVRLDALPGRTLAGRIAAVVPRADLRSRTFPVHVRVANPIAGAVPLLQAGMLARVAFPVGERRRALLVPKDALVLSPGSAVVYALASGPEGEVVQPVPVRVGPAWGGYLQVEAELEPGTRLVVRGNERLRPGQAVRVQQTLSEEEVFGGTD